MGKNKGIKIRPFPTFSPDLNPIENLWSARKAAVATDCPESADQMEDSFHRNWEILTTREALRPYFECLEQRYINCIENEGAIIHY